MAQDDEDVAVQERPKSEPSVLAPLVPAQSSFATDFPASADAPNTTTSVTTDSGKPTGSAFDALLPDPAKMQAAGSALLGERQKMGEAQSYVDRESFGRMERDRDQMDRAFKAEGAAAGAIPPKWDADKERKDRISGPMEQFGSVGSVFAMAASLFTKTPMTSALNAGAAAMKAIQASDEKGYESAYKAWKDNTELALKRFGMEHQMFTDASHLLTTDMNAWAIKQKAIAARFENNTAMIMLENGMYQPLIEAYNAQITAVPKIIEAKKGMEEYNRDRQFYAKAAQAFKEAHPEGATSEQEVQDYLHTVYNLSAAKRGQQQRIGPDAAYTDALYTKYNELMQLPEYRDSSDGQSRAMADAGAYAEPFKKKPGGGTGGAITSNKSDTAEVERRKGEKIKAGMDPTQAFDEAKAEVHATNPTKMTMSNLKAAGVLELQHKNPGMSLEEATKKFETATKPGASLTPEAIDMNARLLIRGNPAAIQNVGRGQQGEATLAAIKNKATDILTKEKGMDSDEAAKYINQNTAAFMGDKRGASNLGLRMSTIVGAATTALATADRVIETSEKVDRTQWSDLNKLILAAEKRTGGTEVIDYGIAVNTLVNNYARAVGGGSAAITDTARKEAHALLNEAWSKGQIKSAVAQLKRELYFELEGTKEARKVWQEGGSPFPEGNVPGPKNEEIIEYDNKGQRVKTDKRSSLDEGRVVSDWEDIPELGQQYAMANKPTLPGEGGLTAEIDKQAGGGFGRGASVPGPSRRQSQTPMSDSEYRSKHMELQQLKGVVMKLGPMREKLTELGATPEQMSKMDAGQAYRFIKERSPGGMGKVNPGWENRNQEFIDRIRSMQDELTSTWQGSK